MYEIFTTTNLISTFTPKLLFSQNSFTLNGYVNDSETGEVLIGATVYVNELKSGTVTNAYGFYSNFLKESIL